MNSKKIIFIFFVLFFYCLSTIKATQKLNIKITANKNLTDSLFYNNNLQIDVLHQSVIEWERLLLKDTTKLTNEDYKRIAISYAYYSNAEKSSEYIEKYIKNTHEINILNQEVFFNISKTKEFKLLEQTYKPEISGWILFFLSIGFMGLFSFIMINVRKNGDLISNLLISFFLLLHSLYIIHLCLVISKYNFKFPHSLYFLKPLFLLYIPLVYFYLKRVIEKYKFKKIDLLHIIPFLIVFIYLIPIYSLSSEKKLNILFNKVGAFDDSFKIIVYVKIILFFLYSFLIFKIFRKLSVNNNKSKVIENIWQKIIVFFFFFYAIIYTVSIENSLDLKILHSQVFLISMIVSYIIYLTYIDLNFFNKISFSKNCFDSKYKKSGLTESFSLELKEQVIKVFHYEKIFKDSSLSLAMLAEKTGTTRHNVSQVINEHFGMSFFRFVNKYRIDETILILNKDLHRNLNIIDVAYDVGFNNKVTFNKAFKAELKMTPSQYIKKIKQK